MKLKSFNYLVSLLIFLICSHLSSEEKIDIWENKKTKINQPSNSEENKTKEIQNINSSQTIKALEKIEIQQGSELQTNEQKVYGIYEPANYNFNLNMWSSTDAEDLKSSLNRLGKIELSKSSNEILEMILFSFSYPE